MACGAEVAYRGWVVENPCFFSLLALSALDEWSWMPRTIQRTMTSYFTLHQRTPIDSATLEFHFFYWSRSVGERGLCQERNNKFLMEELLLSSVKKFNKNERSLLEKSKKAQRSF